MLDDKRKRHAHIMFVRTTGTLFLCARMYMCILCGCMCVFVSVCFSTSDEEDQFNRKYSMEETLYAFYIIVAFFSLDTYSLDRQNVIGQIYLSLTLYISLCLFLSPSLLLKMYSYVMGPYEYPIPFITLR